MGFLENLFNRYTPRNPGEPVFAVIDTETTGVNKRYDRIIELAAVRADAHFNPVDTWHTLLSPDGKAIKNSHIHGITNDMVASAPTFSDVYGDFTSYIDGMQLLAHNAPFDSKMIIAEVDRMTGAENSEEEYFPFIDTIDLAKQMLDHGPYNLPALLDRLGLNNPDAHAAVADATATVNMLHALFGVKRGEIGRKILSQGEAFQATNSWHQSHAIPLLPREI
ncbi:3'-5' exonuclease [Corynebacterium sp. ACRQM]|uniref:3'-5' exonuclease n=1 Tax=unclassified Corynebacterium TaxID=2624378 RepID=UPI001EF721E5|nr:3'-5' exonuclease [Corynebacterium sp. ACRPR]MCG7233214.1 3'-5' exonuclease [Corynebacterium sp. ACRPR]MCG7242823.1 3'-5' exonuclease [Corynebacterium sp. ACRPS]MCG7271379.1 3'-5' exonuclease [Corynebacterium sp. ACRQM]